MGVVLLYPPLILNEMVRLPSPTTSMPTRQAAPAKSHRMAYFPLPPAPRQWDADLPGHGYPNTPFQLIRYGRLLINLAQKGVTLWGMIHLKGRKNLPQLIQIFLKLMDG